jgi:hypothetical protein
LNFGFSDGMKVSEVLVAIRLIGAEVDMQRVIGLNNASNYALIFFLGTGKACILQHTLIGLLPATLRMWRPFF